MLRDILQIWQRWNHAFNAREREFNATGKRISDLKETQLALYDQIQALSPFGPLHNLSGFSV